jgi:LPXTG-site transpeptidase (sortase) family protein
MPPANGLIYDASWQRTSGTFYFNRPEASPALNVDRHKIIRGLGRWLVIFSLAGLLLTYFPIIILNFENGAGQILNHFKEKPSGFGLILAQPLPVVTPTVPPLPPQEERFRLVIPKINADSCVLANIDPQDSQSYDQALKECVAHAKGSGLPGETNTSNRTIYLFAHSSTAPYNFTRLSPVFYSLKDLEIGDQIYLWFWGKKYRYQVSEKKVLENEDTSYFVPQVEQEKLVLQTCYPPGTTWKQLVIVAK